MDPRTIVENLGGPARVAELCGGDVTPQAVSQWYGEGRRIPPGWMHFLRTIRPDAFEPPKQDQRAEA